MSSDVVQKEILLSPRPRGFHVVTAEIRRALPELSGFEVGIAQIFICHTSASLALNEDASPDVRADLEDHFNRSIPEKAPFYRHTLEGPDDMPAHIKAVLLGSSLSLPVRHGDFLLGTWQGIYLCEHRDRGGSRRLVVTIVGQKSGRKT